MRVLRRRGPAVSLPSGPGGRPTLARIARRHARTLSQVVFRFALEVGTVPLTGATDAGHLREDLEAFEFRLGPDEVLDTSTTMRSRSS